MTQTRTAKGYRTRQRLLEAALGLFAEQGYDATTIRDIADAVGCSLGLAYRYFARKSDFVIALYERIASELERELADLAPGPIAARFRTVMQAKLTLVEPHRNTLGGLLAGMLDPNDPVSVLGSDTSVIRARVTAVFGGVVVGADDAPNDEVGAQLIRQLYALHLFVMLLWTQDGSDQQKTTKQAVDGLSELLGSLLPLLGETGPLASLVPLARVDEIFSAFIPPVSQDSLAGVADAILDRVFARRRLLETDHEPCPTCRAVQRPVVERFLEAGAPIHFVLPAFPAKSPNPHATLGPLPDLGEELALTALQDLCDEITQIYPPGARVTLCSDGRVFADIVGITDKNVSDYSDGIKRLLTELGTDAIDTFGLDDVLGDKGSDYPAARAHLDAHYADSLESVRARASERPSEKALFNGMHRFVFEDLVGTRPGESRTQLRREAKEVAYQVIQRSHAWSRVVAECFPAALRLSIHPQPAHGTKIGITLTRAVDNWITPWHGVIVLDDDGYLLMKRDAAEKAGATLVERRGRASHYELPSGRVA